MSDRFLVKCRVDFIPLLSFWFLFISSRRARMPCACVRTYSCACSFGWKNEKNVLCQEVLGNVLQPSHRAGWGRPATPWQKAYSLCVWLAVCRPEGANKATGGSRMMCCNEGHKFTSLGVMSPADMKADGPFTLQPRGRHLARATL